MFLGSRVADARWLALERFLAFPASHAWLLLLRHRSGAAAASVRTKKSKEDAEAG